jgi:hypothetical protein
MVNEARVEVARWPPGYEPLTIPRPARIATPSAWEMSFLQAAFRPRKILCAVGEVHADESLQTLRFRTIAAWKQRGAKESSILGLLHDRDGLAKCCRSAASSWLPSSVTAWRTCRSISRPRPYATTVLTGLQLHARSCLQVTRPRVSLTWHAPAASCNDAVRVSASSDRPDRLTCAPPAPRTRSAQAAQEQRAKSGERPDSCQPRAPRCRPRKAM